MPTGNPLQPGTHVVITGASRGIGAAAARIFAAAGARLTLIARNADAVQALAAQLAAEPGGAAQGMGCDVADFSALSDAVARAEAAFGPTGVLINNAGVIEPIAQLADVDAAAFGKAVDITFKGVFHGMRAVLPGMIARRGGTILTVGSGAAHNPLEGWGSYCAAKAGALMLTRVAHLEAAAAGVRVISLSPGTVATDMQVKIRASGVNPISRLEWSAHIPPEWPAQTLLWMCGSGADGFRGGEVSLREEAVRRQVGLIA